MSNVDPEQPAADDLVFPELEGGFTVTHVVLYAERSWWRRWFSWPWRPWRRAELVTTIKVDP